MVCLPCELIGFICAPVDSVGDGGNTLTFFRFCYHSVVGLGVAVSVQPAAWPSAHKSRLQHILFGIARARADWIFFAW